MVVNFALVGLSVSREILGKHPDIISFCGMISHGLAGYTVHVYIIKARGGLRVFARNGSNTNG
jgi:hypothetical protein